MYDKKLFPVKKYIVVGEMIVFCVVNLRTRFCFKNNARRVLRSPSARAGNAMAKRKRTNH
jgi:hypothetical protein